MGLGKVPLPSPQSPCVDHSPWLYALGYFPSPALGTASLYNGCVCVCVCVCVRERERERQTDRQTDRQREREKERKREGEREREAERKTQTQAQKQKRHRENTKMHAYHLLWFEQEWPHRRGCLITWTPFGGDVWVVLGGVALMEYVHY